MDDPRQTAPPHEKLLPWAPLLLGMLNSYGPVSLNYGFALYFLTYRHGFVKRAFVGELLSPIHWFSRGALLTIEYLFLTVAFGVTYLVFRPMLFGTLPQRRLAAVLLGAPALLPHLGYLFAQPDVTLYILLLLCLLVFLRVPALMAASVSAVLCCVALLAHEAFSLMFYPVVAAILLRLVRQRKLPWAAAVTHLVLFAAVFLAVVHWGTLGVSPDQVLAEAQTRTDVGIQRQVYDVMASSLDDQLRLVRKLYTPDVIKILIATLVISAPYVWVLLRLLNRTLAATGAGRAHRAVILAMFCSPLLLCALGHDTTRWIAALCIDATLFTLFIYMTEPEGSQARKILAVWAHGPSYLLWWIYLTAIGPYGATGLRSAEQLIDAWKGR